MEFFGAERNFFLAGTSFFAGDLLRLPFAALPDFPDLSQ